MTDDLWPILFAFAPPLLIWAGWFGWNLGLAAAGSKTTDAWRQIK